jgi:hypothetical protein
MQSPLNLLKIRLTDKIAEYHNGFFCSVKRGEYISCADGHVIGFLKVGTITTTLVFWLIRWFFCEEKI